MLLLGLSSAHFSSCTRIDNGDLDGLWLITQVDSLQTGTSDNVRENVRTWSFQNNLMQFYNQKGENYDDWSMTMMGRFEHTNDMLIISDPFIYNRMEGNIHLTIDSVQYLAPHYINSLPDTFYIEQLTSKKMRIADDVVRLHLIKY